MTAPARTLVFVPLREEMIHIDSIASNQGYTHARGAFDARENQHTYIFFRSNRQASTVTFQVLGDAGNVRTAATVAAAFQAHRPEVMLLSGLAGSLDHTKARLGDVFVIDMAKVIYPDKIKEMDISQESFCEQSIIPPGGKAADGRIMLDERKAVMGKSNVLRYRRDVARSPSGGMMAANYILGLQTRAKLPLEGVTDQMIIAIPPLERARCININPEIRSGVAFASEMVVDSQAFIDFVLERNRDETIGWYAHKGDRESTDRNPWVKGDIPIVDMESYGFFKFVETMGQSGVAVRAFAVRGVSDLAAGKTILDQASHAGVRGVAVRNAAVVTLDLLRAIDAAELSGRP